MSESETLAGAIVVALLCEEDDETINNYRERSMWVRPFFGTRENSGFYSVFNEMLRNNDATLYNNFVRMSADDFDFLLNLVAPRITKKDTSFRKAISAGERLAITLRYLATGDSYASLMFLFRMSKASISLIIEETCDALYAELKDTFLKVKIFYLCNFM